MGQDSPDLWLVLPESVATWVIEVRVKGKFLGMPVEGQEVEGRVARRNGQRMAKEPGLLHQEPSRDGWIGQVQLKSHRGKDRE